MTGNQMNNLEGRLRELTTWHGEPPEVWKRAMSGDQAGAAARGGIILRILNWPAPRLVAACLGLIVIGLIAVSIFSGDLGKARDQARYPTASALQQSGRNQRNLAEAYAAYPSNALRAQARPLTSRTPRVGTDMGGSGLGSGLGGASVPGRRQPTGRPGSPPGSGIVAGSSGLSGGTGAHSRLGSGLGGGGTSGPAERTAPPLMIAQPDLPPDAIPPDGRHVIQKATIEMKTDDVRGAFLKTQHLISAASGEYVENSSLSGSGRDAYASLTLRIAVDRLSDVLNELRQLGEVTSEQLAGEDVTAQVVDLEARLRNEQRVETELLELLASREDAPLKDVLDLRNAIGQVRRNIEQMTAQRQRLGRLVSLATVLVLIRHDSEADDERATTDQTLGEYFGESIGRSWTTGLQYLADSIAFTVRMLIGGLIWWVLAIAALLLARHLARRKLAAAPFR